MAATSVKRPQNKDRRKVASRRRPPPYDALLDEIDEVVYAVAVDGGDLLGGRVERVSRQAERFTGHPPDDFYRDPGLWWKLVHPEDREAVSRTTQRLAESRQPVTREYRLLDRRSGEYRWIEDRVLPWLDSSGALLGYFGAARDITERRRLHGMLTGVAPALSALTGNGYLRELVGQLAQILETDHALVGELSPGGQAVATVALFSDGRIQQDIEYALAGTPCGHALMEGTLHTLTAGVATAFPGASHLRAQGIESYCGMPLLGVDGAPVGVLAVMSRRPIREPSLVESVLRIFAGRAAAEIERERAVRALQESEERYRSLFEALPIPVICWRHVDGDFVLVEFNRAGLRFTRGRGSELIGRRASELYVNDPSILEDFARCWRERSSFKREMDHTLRSTGESKALAVTYSFAPPDVVLVQLEDETERRQFHETLARSERQYRTLFEEAPAGILVMGNDRNILHVNRRLCQLLGFSREELTGQRARALLEEGGELVPLGLASTRAGNRVVVERRLRRKDGTWIEAEVSARQVEAGRILAIVRDVSERKRAEAALRQLSARVLQLQDEERRRIARELHDGTGQALTGLALKLSAFLRTARLDRPARNTLRGAKKLAEQCARETRTLSYLLHPPLLEEAGLSAALAWLVDGFAERSGIRSRLEQPQGDARLPPEIELALFRVVQEGLANVHRHSGSPTAEVRMVKRQGEVSVEIRDKGRGIPRSQLSQAMTRGVGIAGMRERLHELGGQLEVRSSPRGTAVRAIVPIAVEHA